MILTASQINISDLIGSAEIGRAHRFISPEGNYFLVENSKKEIDPETGEIIEYKVTHDSTGFHCDCEAGKRGFASCKKYGVCSHVRIALACAREERIALLEMTIAQAQAELAELVALSQPTPVIAVEEVEVKAVQEEHHIVVNGVVNPPDVMSRIRANAAKPEKPARNIPSLQSRPFSLMR